LRLQKLQQVLEEQLELQLLKPHKQRKQVEQLTMLRLQHSLQLQVYLKEQPPLRQERYLAQRFQVPMTL
jgi:hypothetical protein